MAEHHIYREEAPVFRLDKKGIQEVVGGLTSSATLRQKYNVEIDPELPAIIADDLLEDKHSPIAPVLQIILTKLWQKQRQEPVKKFQRNDYQQLKREGVLLKDFFDQQMAAIRAWESEIQTKVESSGLALDILNFHVTALATADTRELDNLRRLYEHRAEILDQLIHKFQDLYLLTGLNDRQTRLAHDTLAPIVQQRMRTSDYPGQRALRILEAKMTDYLLSPQTTYIDEEDLKIVESGAQGMRRWLPKEWELIEKSRKRRAALEAERTRNRLFRWAAVAVVALLAIVATVFWRSSERGKRLAEANALYNEGRLLAATDPTAGLTRMEEALRITPEDRGKKQGHASLFARNMFYEVIHRSDDGFLNRAAVSPDGDYLAVSLDIDNEIRLYDGTTGELLNRLQGPNSPIFALTFVNNDLLLAGSEDRNAYLWQLPNASRITLTGPAGREAASVRSLAYSSDGQWILTGHGDRFARLWQASSGQMEREFSTQTEVQDVAFHPNGRELFLGVEDGIYHFDLTGEERQFWHSGESPLTALAFDPNEYEMLTGHENGVLARWRPSPNGYMPADSTQAHQGAVTAITFSSNGQYFFSVSRDQTAKAWATGSGELLYTMQGHAGPIHSLSLLKDQSAVITAAEDSTVRRWAFPYPLPWKILETSGFQVNDLCWSPDGQYLLAASIDRKVYVRSSESYEQAQVYTGHRAGVQSLPVSSDGRLAASGDRRGNVQIWTLATGELVAEAQLHESAVNELVFGTEDNFDILASAGDDRQVVIWNWRQEEPDTARLSGHAYEVMSLDFSPDDRQLATTGLDSNTMLWDVNTRRLLDTFHLNAAGLQTQFANDRRHWVMDDNRIIFLVSIDRFVFRV